MAVQSRSSAKLPREDWEVSQNRLEKGYTLSEEESCSPLEHDQAFKDHLLGGPKFDDFEVERPKDSGRDIDL